MATLRWTAEAEQWLRDIYDYIAHDDPTAAARTIETIYQRTEILKEFPESGYRYWQNPNRHIRILLHGHYRIAYVVKSSEAIDILGVFHGALNIDRYLL
jgi:toxin ParE1/3/4